MEKTGKKRKEEGRKKGGAGNLKSRPGATESRTKKELKPSDASKKRKQTKVGVDAKKNRSRSPSKNRPTDQKINKKVHSIEGRKMRPARSRSQSSHKKVDARGKDVSRNRKKMELDMSERVRESQGGSCFLCFCCGGNEEEQANEIMIQDQLREEIEAKERERQAEEERMERLRVEKELERLRRAKEEEEARIQREREEAEEEERRKQLEEQMKQEMETETTIEKGNEINKVAVPDEAPKTVLKRIELKVKQPPKKAKLNFVGAAAAPPPPEPTACVGEPPKVRPTNVSLGEGVYLIYRAKDNGELVIKYSKSGIQGNGVLAYIDSKTIPPFYFDQNRGETIVISNMSSLMQSNFINDRKSYYTTWIDFVKKAKQFNGKLYLLPASESQPPPKTDLLLLTSATKKITQLPIEKPVELSGDYLIAIQGGLEIFKKEIDVNNVISYVKNFGALMEI